MSNQNNIQTYDANASQEVPDQSLPVTSIRLLETGGYTGHVAMLHGVVTRTDPLYIEDDTGGIAVHMSHTASVNLGDEVELLGSVVEAGAFPSFDATTLRLLWAGTPLIASSITSSQAASGRFEGSLVELSGMLIAKHKSPQGDIVLELADIDQHFRIEVPQGLSDKAFNSWQEGSELRVRGICANELSADASEIPFSILVRSDGDVQVISGPPWNHGMRLVYLLMVVGMLGVAGVYLYLRAERWRMRAIMQERERLAIDIHDTLAQSFAGVGFQLQSLRKGLREQGGISTSLLRKIDVACEMAAHTHREATSAIFSLQPGGSADGDLITLLQRACMSMLEGAHLQIKLHRSGESQAISLPVQDALFRIGREAFSNVLRHSKATEVTISIDYGARVLKLSLSDNGVGFNVDQENRGFGLQGMVIRGEKVGAVINVRSAPRCGTTIAVVAPYGRWFSLSDWIRLQFGHMTKRFDVQSSSSRTNP
jgi:signal transduction histidine kinase